MNVLTDTTPSAHTFIPARRIQESVLIRAEKHALHWLAHRMPARVNSDHLTVLALAAMIGVGASYWVARVTPWALLAGVVLLAVNWFGDSLDGTLARVRNQQRPRYGYYVDHVVDVVGVVFLFGGLALSGLMQPTIAVGLLLAYFLLSLEVYLATHSLGRFQMSFFGFGPTELRILLAVGNIAMFVEPTHTVWGTTFTPFDVGGILGGVGLVATFIYSAVRNTRALYLAEPIPERRQS